MIYIVGSDAYIAPPNLQSVEEFGGGMWACLPTAPHVCGLSGIFGEVHAPAKNDLNYNNKFVYSLSSPTYAGELFLIYIVGSDAYIAPPILQSVEEFGGGMWACLPTAPLGLLSPLNRFVVENALSNAAAG